MKPILFAKDETDFTTNGLGRIDCISCKVIEERNGMYELEAEVPISGNHVSEIEMQSIIGVIPHDGGNVQAFVVYKITKPINGRFMVYARHITYRLTDIPCMPFTVALSANACAQTLAGLKNNALEACPFNFSTDLTTAASYTQKVPASIRQRLGGVEGSVLDQFGGEYEWDNWNIRLLKKRGRLANVTGITLRYGKNIIDINQEEEIANTVTGIVPFWADTDGNNLVTLPANERVVYSDNADNYPYHMTQPMDFSASFQEKPTVAQLRTKAQAYVHKSDFGVPKVSIKVSFVNLWETEEYKDIAPLERVQLCDEINVVFEKLGVNAIAKVVKTDYDVLNERYNSIEVGSIRGTLAQAITDRDKEIDSIYVEAISRVSQAVMDATAWLTSANGYVVAVKNDDGSWKELLFMDTNDPTTARNGLRINEHGIGFWRYDKDGGNVLDGPYSNAWTIDGSFIADYIRSGKLTVGGNGTNAVIEVVNASNNWVTKLDKDGVTMKSGSIYSADYQEKSPVGPLSRTGMKVDVTNKFIKTPHFAIDVDDGITMDKGTIKSSNYSYSSGHFANAGMMIDLINRFIRSKFFAFDDNGAYINGQIEANSGNIGAAEIDEDSLTVKGNFDLFSGNLAGHESFEFKLRPYEYKMAEDFAVQFSRESSEGSSISCGIWLYEHDEFVRNIWYGTLDYQRSITSSSLSHLVGQDDGNYYLVRAEVNGDTGVDNVKVSLYQVILGYIGNGGIKGMFSGIMEGYLNDVVGMYKGELDCPRGKIGYFAIDGVGGIEAQDRIDIEVFDHEHPSEKGKIYVAPNYMSVSVKNHVTVTEGVHEGFEMQTHHGFTGLDPQTGEEVDYYRPIISRDYKNLRNQYTSDSVMWDSAFRIGADISPGTPLDVDIKFYIVTE